MLPRAGHWYEGKGCPAALPTGLGWSLGLGWADSSGEVLGVGGSPALVGWLGQPQLLLQGGPQGWCWRWAWLGCDWAEDSRKDRTVLPLPHGTSRNRPDASPHAAPSSGSRSRFWLPTQHPAPSQVSSGLCTAHSATGRAGRAKGLPQTRQLGGVPCLHTFPQLLVTSAWLSPAGSILSRGWPSGSGEACCPLWSHQAGPYRPSHPSGRPPSFLFCCLFLRENSTRSQNRKQSQHPPRLSAVHCPLPEWAQCIQLPSLSSSPGKPHAYPSLRISPHAWHHSCP